MPVTIFFLRAVNVGGASSIKMAALRELCPALGLRHAATLLQSGNLVAAHDGPPDDLARALEGAIAATHPMRPHAIARSIDALKDILAHPALPASEAREPNKLLVMPLTAAPADGAIERLRAWHKGPEEIALRGPDLYLYYGEGIGRSKLTNVAIERHLGVQGTGRNWTTLTKLAALADEVAARG